MEIAEWLASLGLGAYAQAFCENHIEIENLSSLTMDDLKEIGVTSVGHRRRILSATASLQKTQPHSIRPIELQTDQIAGERRQVTVLFADIAGYSSLSNELDAEHVHALLSAFFEQVDRIISDFGGRIDKHIGDCAMAVFGAPIAHSDDVRRAVAAALSIHETMDQVSGVVDRPIAAHVGIASGEVVANHTGSSRFMEYTVTGETVNLASRLTGLAKSGETIASADIISTLAEGVVADFAGTQLVKGFSVPVNFWRVRGLREIEATQRSLIGRDTEIAQCEAGLLATRDGHSGSTIYIRGEPGIGKSSLASEIRRQAERLGFVVVRAAVFDFGTGLDRDPLRVLTIALLNASLEPESLRQAVEAFASTQKFADETKLALNDLAGFAHTADERRLLDAMSPETRLAARSETLASLALAASRATPLLIIVEDIHWADLVTLHGLATIVRVACHESRTVVLITSRIESDPLPTLQPLMSHPPEMVIELNRLSEQDAHELAERLLDTTNPLIEQCVARAGGNPLFLEQLIRHASSGGLISVIPGSIRSVVTAQIDQLASSDKSAVQTAAILGAQFSVEAVRRLLGRGDWNPETLIERRLVFSENGVLHFTHALIRDGIYASILNPERCRLHLAAAEWFVGRDLALRAEHLAKADDPGAVAAYLMAVDELVAVYRIDEALALLDRAGAIARQPVDQFAVSLQEGHLLADAGRSADAIVAYDKALNTASVEEEIAAAKLGKAGALRLLDRNAEALALLVEAEPALLAKSRIADLALLEHLRGNLLFPLGQTAACQTAHEKALDYAERCGSVEPNVRALGGLGDAAYANGRVNTARRLFAECIELARQHGFGRIEVANAPMLASLSADAKTVLLEIGRAIDAAAKARQPRAELTGHLIAMSWLLCSGRPTAIKSHFDRAQEIILQIGSRRLSAMNVTIMAEAHRQLGDRERAVAMHEEALAIAREIGMSYVGGIILAFRALATHDTLDMRRASLREGERVVSEGSVSTTTLFFYCFAIESCLLAEDWGEARRLADRLIMSFALEQPPIVAFVTERCRLLADAAEKGLDQALRRSLEKCRDNGRALGFGLFLGLLDQCLD
jgi:class 3 adenylate cyclase/tetratricopeptide (TPR) repeat protein